MAIRLINQMSMEVKQKEQEELVLNTQKEKHRLEEYPAYGSKYGNVEIDSISVNLPLYYGDTDNILNLGIGHYSSSYCPGEGGSVICCAHNTARFLRRLPEVKVGDKIKITTTYGEFNYKVYDTQVIHQSESEKLPVQSDEEILMMYTCYPVTGVGHKTNRFVVYAELMEE